MNCMVAGTITVLVLCPVVAEPSRGDVAAEQVRNAIERGVAYLLSQQRDDGSWPDDYVGEEYVGGVSALCTLALLNSGVEVDQEQIQKSLKYLRTVGAQRTYTVALQTMVFARASPEKDRTLIERNVKWLEKSQIVGRPGEGAWSYSDKAGTVGDNSNSQFALLALHEAERVGIVARNQTWQLAYEYWRVCQLRDGSWGYKTHYSAGSASMTCAGITSSIIAGDTMQGSDARAIGDHIECCLRGNYQHAKSIDRAIGWLGRHFSVTSNPNSGRTLYYLYGLERACRLTARRFIPLPSRPGQPDRADWYREGADYLVRSQDQHSGFWTETDLGNNERLVGTSFAVLFLSKGRWPVLLGKLEYSLDYSRGKDWNRHHCDVNNLTRYVETRWKRDLTWQVVDLKRASVDELLQTPVLYLSGRHSPLPVDRGDRKELAQKLRDYVDRSGFLLAEANCACGGFDQGFRELMREAFPEPEYSLRLLEPEHPIWRAEEKIEPRQLRPLWGIEFGCRTSVVYAPLDPPEEPRPSLSCLWELSRPGRGVKYSPVVQAQIDAAMSLGLNVLAYATNRELKTKEDFFRPINTPPPGDPVQRGRLDVATLRHPGDCNVTPRALLNLTDAVGSNLKIRVHVRPELLDIIDPALFDYPLVFMHGRTSFRLTDDERRQLKQYLERGGMLLADSVCASPAFRESFHREMAAIFPDRKLERIPATDPLLSTIYGGFDLRVVSRREPKAAAPGQGLVAAVRKGPPDLEGLQFVGRWGVVFSQYDLSCALEKQDSLKCRGYTREDAARIGFNVVLYSLQQ
jgi:hypothetical protein